MTASPLVHLERAIPASRGLPSGRIEITVSTAGPAPVVRSVLVSVDREGEDLDCKSFDDGRVVVFLNDAGLPACVEVLAPLADGELPGFFAFAKASPERQLLVAAERVAVASWHVAKTALELLASPRPGTRASRERFRRSAQEAFDRLSPANASWSSLARDPRTP